MIGPWGGERGVSAPAAKVASSDAGCSGGGGAASGGGGQEEEDEDEDEPCCCLMDGSSTSSALIVAVAVAEPLSALRVIRRRAHQAGDMRKSAACPRQGRTSIRAGARGCRNSARKSLPAPRWPLGREEEEEEESHSSKFRWRAARRRRLRKVGSSCGRAGRLID